MSRKTKKMMWAVPLMAVIAVIGALAIFAAQTPSPALAHGLPGAVTKLEAKADGTKAVDLSWSAPSTGGAPTGYRIDVSADGQTWSAHATTTDTSYRDTKLAKGAGSVRYYRVFAVNSAGTGPVSETVGPADVPLIGGPGGVTGLKVAVAANKKAINVTWNAPAKDGGAPIENYLVVYAMTEASLGLDPTSNAAESSVSDVRTNGATTRGIAKTADATTSYTLNGTMANEQWWFRVYAYNGARISVNALETRTTGTIPVGNPDPPTGVTAVQVPGVNSVNLYWYWPASNGGQAIENFQVQRKTGSGRWGTLAVPPVAGSSTDPTPPVLNMSVDAEDMALPVVTLATSGIATHSYRVRTVTGAGAVVKRSEWSTPGSVSIDAAKLINPGDRTEGCPDPLTDADGDTAAVKDLKVDCRAQASLVQAGVVNGNPVSTAPGDELSAARDGKGNVEITISRHIPKAATSFRIDVANVLDGSGIAASARWRPVLASTGNLGTGGEFVYEYLDETTGSQLQYRVFGKKGSIIVPANDMVSHVEQKTVSAPTQVIDLTATGVSATQIDVSWTAPESDGDAAIDMYCVQVSANVAASLNVIADQFDALAAPGGGDDDTAEDLCAVDTAAGIADTFELVEGRSYSHKKLNAASTWYFRVYAINNPVFGGDNRAVNSATIAGVTKAADKPAMPQGLVAEQAKDSNYGGSANSGVYVTWNAPANPAGDKIDGYRVERMVNQGSWTTLDSDTKSTETVFYDILETAVGEMRAYRVAARVKSDVGPWSNTAYYPAMHTVDTSHNTAPMADGMIAPVTVTAGEMSDAMDVSAYFSDADMGDMLTYTAMSDMMSYATVSVSGSMVTITGVAAGTATITVTATDVDRAMATQAIMVTVEAVDTTPMAPTGVMATVDESDPGSTSVTVTWTDGANVEAHGVVLFANDFTEWDYIGRGTGGSHTFLEVASGSYIAVVVALDAQGGLMPDAQGNYLYAGATVVSVH